MGTDDLLCSRNARPGKALVGRAQWKINQPPSPEMVTSELGGSIIKGCSLDARSGGLILAILEQRTRASLEGALREK